MRNDGSDNNLSGPADRNLPAPTADGRAVASSNAAGGYGFGTYSVAESTGEDIDLVALARRLFGIAMKWRYVILGSAAVFMAAALAYIFLTTPLYSATVRIQIDREAGKVVDGGLLSPAEQGGTEFQRTQNELLKSRGIAERTVSALSLDRSSEFKEKPTSLVNAFFRLFSGTAESADSTATEEKARQHAVERVQDDVQIIPLANSRLVDIIYTDASPTLASTVANAYADSFVASNLDKRFEASAYAKVFLEDQIKQLKLRLEESERAIISFSEHENMVQTNDKVSIAESNLAAANTALGLLISNRIRDEETWRQVENTKGINLPQLLSNSVIDGLRAQRNEARREYEEKLETFKPGYPAMVQISSKIAEIDRQIASEVATIRNSLRAAYESSANQDEQMRKRIDELRAEVIELQKKNIQYGILQREVDSNRSLYNGVVQRYKEVDVASGVGTNNVFIVDRALSGSRSHPRAVRILSIASLFGLLIGFAGVSIVELFDDRVRTPEDAQKASGLPLLGIVPHANFSRGVLTELGNPRSGLAEAYRSLATSLQFATETGLPRTLVVSSGGPAEGKSTTAIALARHFAVTGKRVLLVDADLRRPSVHTKIGLPNGVGLTNVLTGMNPMIEVIQATPVDNLWFVASGPLPPNAAEILGGTQVFSFISVGLEMFDLIIFDSPPMLGLADAQLLGAAASATIFVMGAGDARRGLIRGALRRLELSRALPIGVVLTKFHAHSAGYGYNYNYDYDYGAEQQSREPELNRGIRRLPGLKSKQPKPSRSEVS